jgi:hypothetical protein
MPAQSFSPMTDGLDDTFKRCPPFVDAMAEGFLLPLLCDVEVRDGQLTWDLDLPPLDEGQARSPLSFHDPAQVAGSPLWASDEFLLKLHNVWTIGAPPGYSLLFTHPVNRFDLPFTTLTGLVDCDLYRYAPIHFPARWVQPDFAGVLPRGTPIAQCIPVRRDRWRMETATLSEDDVERSRELLTEIRRAPGHYRRRLRAHRR